MYTYNILKCKVVPVYAMKAWGRRCITPLIPNGILPLNTSPKSATLIVMNTNNILKCNVVPVYAMKAWVRRCIAPLSPSSILLLNTNLKPTT